MKVAVVAAGNQRANSKDQKSKTPASYLFALCFLLFALCSMSALACRKPPPRAKVVNPMIDSAEKFVQVYTESLPPPQSGLELYWNMMSGKPETTREGIFGESAPATGTASGSHETAKASVESSAAARSKLPSPGSPSASSQAKSEIQNPKSKIQRVLPDTSEPIYNAGTVEMDCLVHHVGVEGGFWGLTADNGQNYDPLNLPDTLKQAGIKVHFYLRMRKDLTTTHMWGTPVQIVAYSIPNSPKVH
jgi:hypothetical protein